MLRLQYRKSPIHHFTCKSYVNFLWPHFQHQVASKSSLSSTAGNSTQFLKHESDTFHANFIFNILYHSPSLLYDGAGAYNL